MSHQKVGSKYIPRNNKQLPHVDIIAKKDGGVTNIWLQSFTAMTGKGPPTRRASSGMAQLTTTKTRIWPKSPTGEKKKKVNKDDATASQAEVEDERRTENVKVEEVEVEEVSTPEPARGSGAPKDDNNNK